MAAVFAADYGAPVKHGRVHAPIVTGPHYKKVIMASSLSTVAEPRRSSFSKCWSCRLLGAAGLYGGAAYVFQAARRTMAKGAAVGPGTVTQIVFSLCLFSLGTTILIDPVGSMKIKD
ncbi:hypothetical protein NDU88_005863 [Pleurodeles waltl]|uniref:Distal membrane-arm assembly complex protein 1-like domain-containing protein n=1 Tax=Pleurodeles waltl TaxID=8319 RepID=A0AAV7MZ89_PLEWA|nr:hypothetical protein NDU88_005863 [Pleurodeles waltl]